MPPHRHVLLFLSLLCTILPTFAVVDDAFENSAVVRTVELGGSTVHVRTTYAIRALQSGAKVYSIALGEREAERTHYIDVRVKGQKQIPTLEDVGFQPKDGVHLYTAVLPKPLKVNETATIELETVLTKATYPWPPKVDQKDDLAIKLETDLFVISPYKTVVQRTKVRAPKPEIISYTEPKDVEAFTLDNASAKSGATITYGPFNNIPPSATREFIGNHQQNVVVHYKYSDPMLEIFKLKRSAEISHWGSNLNIEDQVWLHNSGPELHGQFSRLEYMQQRYYQKQGSHILHGLMLQLPPGISNVYYYDRVGNVTTSRFRSAPSVPKGTTPKQFSIFEMRPRFPMMGGWNYSFTLGWDSALQDSASYDSKEGKYIVAVPMMTKYPDTVVNEAEVRIVLPEGATDVEVFPAFPPKEISESIHKTYLDTTGRPTVTLQYEQLTERHTGTIYVSYRVPFSAHLQKPLAVAAVIFGLFTVAMAAGGVDMKIQRKK